MSGISGQAFGTFGAFIRTSIKPCVTVPANVEYAATAGQVTFNVTQTPSGPVGLFRNGVRLPIDSVSYVGTVVTYLPAQNSGVTMVAGDRVTIEYFWVDCGGVATGIQSICDALNNVPEGGSVG